MNELLDSSEVLKLYYGRADTEVTEVIVNSEAELKRTIYDVANQLNSTFVENNNSIGYILANDVVYAVTPSLKHKKITGNEAKQFKRQVTSHIKNNKN